LHDKEKEVLDLRQEVLGLKHSLKEANDQCTLLFNKVQKAWRVSSTLQADLKVAFDLSAVFASDFIKLVPKTVNHDAIRNSSVELSEVWMIISLRSEISASWD